MSKPSKACEIPWSGEIQEWVDCCHLKLKPMCHYIDIEVEPSAKVYKLYK